jgi:hypothetical protein
MPISNPAVGHREWNWADECSWKNHVRIPLGLPTKVGTAFSIRVGKFDSVRASSCSICYYQGNYYCVYQGYNGVITRIGIAKATASDFPATWTQYDNPIIPSGGAANWDYQTLDGDIIVDEVAGVFKLYYCGYRDATGLYCLGLATCPLTSDPTVAVNWTENGGNPIWSPANFGTSCGILRLGNLYYLQYYDLTHTHLHVATSTNGTTFTDRGNTIALGAAATWDDVYVYYASMFFNQGIIYSLYSGYSGTRVAIGLACSEGNPYSLHTTWTKAWENPILSEGAADIHHPCMIMVNEKFYIFYTDETASWSVKYATIP